MSKLQRIIIFILALGIIGLLIFFAFSVFIIALIIAPIAYLYNKFRGKEAIQMQQADVKESNNSTVIDADYEVIKDSHEEEQK